MEILSVVIRYWLFILYEAWKTATKNSNVKGYSLAIIGTFTILNLLLAANVFGILPDNWEIAIFDFEAEVRVSAIYGFFGVILCAVIFCFSVIYVPAKIHNEKEQIIERYKGREMLARAEKLIFSALNKSGGPNVRIKNEEGKSFEGSLHIVEVDGEEPVNTSNLHRIDRGGDYFYVESNVPIVLSFVRISPRDGSVTLAGFILENGIHRITTVLNGKFDFVKINPRKDYWELDVDKESGKLELSLLSEFQHD